MAALQGLLVGPYRSPVQIKALLIKQYVDIIAEVTTTRAARTEALKLAMGASGHWTFESLFPEAFRGAQKSATPEPAPTDDAVDVAPPSWSPDKAWDYSAVEWKTPTESKDEYDEIMRKLAAKTRNTMNGTQITTKPKFPMQGKWR
jgi:hypothetical protein